MDKRITLAPQKSHKKTIRAPHEHHTQERKSTTRQDAQNGKRAHTTYFQMGPRWLHVVPNRPSNRYPQEGCPQQSSNTPHPKKGTRAHPRRPTARSPRRRLRRQSRRHDPSLQYPCPSRLNPYASLSVMTYQQPSFGGGVMSPIDARYIDTYDCVSRRFTFPDRIVTRSRPLPQPH